MQTLDGDLPLGPSRALLFALGVSLAVHIVGLALFDRSEPTELGVAPKDRTLLVNLEHPAPDEVPNAPATVISQQQPSQAAADGADAEPSAVENPQPDQPPDGLNVTPLEIREFVRSYEASSAQPDPLAFRPMLRDRLDKRQAQQHRIALVDRSRVERLGHAEEIINGYGDMTRIGNQCFATSIPAVTIQRGQQVSQVECPGIVDWWKRSDLDDVAAFRGIP